MKTYLLIFATLFCFFGYAQDELVTNLWLDEESKTTTKDIFQKKADSFLYKSKRIKKDTFTINTLSKSYHLGKFSTQEFSQIKTLLFRDIVVDSKKSIIISFKDSIFGENELSKSNPKFGKEKQIAIKKHYKKNRKNRDRKIKKCLKKHVVLTKFYFKDNFNFTYKPKHYKLEKAPKALKNILFKGFNNAVAIIKPNGNFIVYSWLLEDDYVTILLNTENWNQYFKDFSYAQQNLPSHPTGFFQDIYQRFGSKLEATSKTKTYVNIKGETKTALVGILKEKSSRCFTSAYY